MNELLEGRKFQFWEYRVSHGSLLIRSPRVGGLAQNIDIMFFDVEYVSLPRFLGDVTLEKPHDSEVQNVRNILRKIVAKEAVFIIESDGRRFAIVAGAGVQVKPSDVDIFDSPFDL